MKPPPTAFKRFEILVMNDFIDLLAQLPIEFSDHRLNRSEDVVTHEASRRQGLFRQSLNCRLNCTFRRIRLRLELLA